MPFMFRNAAVTPSSRMIRVVPAFYSRDICTKLSLNWGIVEMERLASPTTQNASALRSAARNSLTSGDERTAAASVGLARLTSVGLQQTE